MRSPRIPHPSSVNPRSYGVPLAGLVLVLAAGCMSSQANHTACAEAAEMVAECTGAAMPEPVACGPAQQAAAEEVLAGGCAALESGKSDATCSEAVQALDLCDAALGAGGDEDLVARIEILQSFFPEGVSFGFDPRGRDCALEIVYRTDLPGIYAASYVSEDEESQVELDHPVFELTLFDDGEHDLVRFTHDEDTEYVRAVVRVAGASETMSLAGDVEGDYFQAVMGDGESSLACDWSRSGDASSGEL